MSYTTTINLQKHLASKGFYKGKADNLWGRLTDNALLDFLDSRKGKLTFNWKKVGFQRRLIATWQLICLEAGIHEVGVIDGYRGPATDYALEILESIVTTGKRPVLWRDEIEKQEPQRESFPPVKTLWPFQKDVQKFYGAPGENQTMLVVPYVHKIAWAPKQTIKQFSIHEKVHDSALRVLNRALDHYGITKIKKLRLDYWAGCLNVRAMRGGSALSMHSWGIALDYDSERNQYKWGRDKATFAKPEYEMWWKLWEEEGWVSLGRARNYDWMHVQAARL